MKTTIYPAVLNLDTEQATFCVEYLRDHNILRSANAANVNPDTAYKWLSSKSHPVRRAIDRVLADRLAEIDIDSQWVLTELRDNHTLARHQGNITASNKALDQIAKHKDVDAYAANKVDANVSGELGLTVAVKRYSDGAVIEGQATEVHDAGAGGSPAAVSPPISFL